MRSYIKTSLIIALVVVILWWFGSKLDWAEVRNSLRGADWRFIGAAVALICTTYVLRAFRWRVFLLPLARVSIRDLFAATTVGFGAVFLLGRAGELVRPAFLSLRAPGVRPAASFITIGVERIFDMASLVIMFALALLLIEAPEGSRTEFELARKAGFVLLFGIGIGISLCLLFRRYAPAIIGRLDARPNEKLGFVSRVRGLLTGILRQLNEALGVLTNVGALLASIGWSALLWIAVALANMFVLRAFGLPLGIAEAVFVMGWSLVGSLVPMPGGAAGTFHGTTIIGLGLLGVAREQATAAAIVLHLTVFAPALFLGLYSFLRSGVNLGRLRQATAKGAEADVTTDTALTH